MWPTQYSIQYTGIWSSLYLEFDMTAIQGYVHTQSYSTIKNEVRQTMNLCIGLVNSILILKSVKEKKLIV